MSLVVKSGNTVKRTATLGSHTVQQFLAHMHQAGIDWVPIPLGFDDNGRELLSYIDGDAVDGVPPGWFWDESLLADIAQRLRQFHDASTTFRVPNAVWNWEAIAPAEVITHRDFAPYNCIFREEKFAGLIDFDLCAPGPRIWDIAYTAYRFVPLMPASDGQPEEWLKSRFDTETMLRRLDVFLASYCGGGQQCVYSRGEVLETTMRRLDAMVDWINDRVKTHPNTGLAQNATTYAHHRAWLTSVCEA